jgi:polysaccharide export outer membrane protein
MARYKQGSSFPSVVEAMSRIFLALAVTLAVLGGCSAPRYGAEQFRAAIDAPYQLASGDRLRVIVFGQDGLTNSFSVDGVGNVSMPLIGTVRAQGLTTAQLATSIEAHLRNGYLRDPHVSVEVEAFRPFFVLGEVGVAGQYPFVNGTTVQNAIAIAGGFGPRGYKDTVDLTRIVGGEPLTTSVPLSFPVRPGDTITVRERFF